MASIDESEVVPAVADCLAKIKQKEILYRSCWSGHEILVTGFSFRTGPGNQFLVLYRSAFKKM